MYYNKDLNNLYLKNWGKKLLLLKEKKNTNDDGVLEFELNLPQHLQNK